MNPFLSLFFIWIYISADLGSKLGFCGPAPVQAGTNWFWCRLQPLAISCSGSDLTLPTILFRPFDNSGSDTETLVRNVNYFGREVSSTLYSEYLLCPSLTLFVKRTWFSQHKGHRRRETCAHEGRVRGYRIYSEYTRHTTIFK